MISAIITYAGFWAILLSPLVIIPVAAHFIGKACAADCEKIS